MSEMEAVVHLGTVLLVSCVRACSQFSRPGGFTAKSLSSRPFPFVREILFLFPCDAYVPFPFGWVRSSQPSESNWDQQKVQLRSSEIKCVPASPSEIKWIQLGSSGSKWSQESPSEIKSVKWVQVKLETSSEMKWDLSQCSPISLSNFSWLYRYIACHI